MIFSYLLTPETYLIIFKQNKQLAVPDLAQSLFQTSMLIFALNVFI